MEGVTTRFERGVVVFGLGMAILLLTEILVVYFIHPGLARALVAASMAGLFLGREAGIPTGLALGVHPILMLQASATLDLASGATGFGTLLHLVDRPNRLSRWARRYLEKTEEEARGQQGFLRRWGPAGAFMFMLVPFMVNGPLVVATAGRISGLRSQQLAWPIVSATFVAAAIWVAFSGAMLRLISSVEPGLEIAATGVFLGAMLGFAIIRFYQAQKRVRRQQAGSDTVPKAAEGPEE